MDFSFRKNQSGNRILTIAGRHIMRHRPFKDGIKSKETLIRTKQLGIEQFSDEKD